MVKEWLNCEIAEGWTLFTPNQRGKSKIFIVGAFFSLNKRPQDT
jgi:hypothetical protein